MLLESPLSLLGEWLLVELLEPFRLPPLLRFPESLRLLPWFALRLFSALPWRFAPPLALRFALPPPLRLAPPLEFRLEPLSERSRAGLRSCSFGP